MIRLLSAALLALGLLATPALPDTHSEVRGAVTNLPLPRFVSLKASEGNARRGPSLSHRIDWVFQHRNMPLRITAEFENWRRVEDRDGAGGWVHYTLLSGVRSVVFIDALTDIYAKPDTAAPVVARAEEGVIAWLDSCTLNWCRVNADGTKGWAAKTTLWGVDATELRE